MRKTLAVATALLVVVGLPRHVFPQREETELSCAAFRPPVSEADLVARFGRDNVTDARIFGSDDGPVDGSAIFPNDPASRLDVFWKDPGGHQQALSIRARDEGSRWRTIGGITVGMTLRQVELINGRPFRMAGFQTELQGAVRSWSGGALDAPATPGCQVVIKLQPRYDGTGDPALMRQVSGPGVYSSGHPAMLAINPRVVAIEVRHSGG